MKLLKEEQVRRVHEVTDGLRLHRDWVVVPLNAHEAGLELVMPDGKLLVRPPEGEAFESWLAGLRDRLEALDLKRIPPPEENDPKYPLTGPGAPRLKGTRYYLDDRGILGES